MKTLQSRYEASLKREQLIETARLAFMDGMVASAAVAGAIAFTNAVLVKMYMPRRVIHSEKD